MREINQEPKSLLICVILTFANGAAEISGTYYDFELTSIILICGFDFETVGEKLIRN